ncbi:MAG: HAD family phosphatase [Anaerolineales bacterium]|nr:HAD family phosphatase [Anaerolineales bacterium]
MTIKAIYLDFGGVIARTEHETPRQHLAQRLNIEYEDLVNLVFNSPSARQATVGQVSARDHWAAVLSSLNLPEKHIQPVINEFFGGDIIDRELLDKLRLLRPRYKIGLISNAWDDLRAYIAQNKFEDVFDTMVISAEVRIAKPEAAIFQIALEKLGVKANQAVFVDDFVENITAARELGMYTIHFREINQAKTELERVLKAT